MGPCVRVWSREIGKGLERGAIVEAFEPCSIVVSDEAIEEGIAVLMRFEQPARDTPFWLAADGIDDAPVEALDKTIGLGSIGPG